MTKVHCNDNHNFKITRSHLKKSNLFLRFFLLVIWLALFSAVFATLSHISRAVAEPSIPPTWDILYDDFESGTLDKWQLSSPDCLTLIPGGGYTSSTGLSVAVSSNSCYIYQTNADKAEEGYLSFWFNPNGVIIPDPGDHWIPDKSLFITGVVNSTDWWPPIVALYVRRPEGQGYQAYLSWPIDEAGQIHFDYDNAFDLVDGWQQITIGYHLNEWVAVWRNSELMRYATDVVHTDPYGDICFFGKINTTNNIPSGEIFFDDVAFQVPRVDNLWVDANNGDDNNDGLTSDTAFSTIQKAGDQAGPGTTVHILPGIYRETVAPVLSGNAENPINYIAENGSGTVEIRGSEPSSSLVWTQLTGNTIGLPSGVDPSNIYSTDLSAWNLNGPPRFVVELDDNGQVVARLPMAREPDWSVVTEWKYPEYWWTADGGSNPAACDPATDPDPNCDQASRSTNQLTDKTDDTDPPGVEAGNLTTLGDLTGATLVAIDTKEGHYAYRRTIIAHDIAAGTITVGKSCEFDSPDNPGLGWGSKYYVEGKPYLLDTPGEWWYDNNTKQLYLWPLTAGNPTSINIEISRRDIGFNLQNRSYITLEDLTIEFFNSSNVSLVDGPSDKSYGITLHNLILRYANYGLNIEKDMNANESFDNIIDGFTLEDSEVAYIDTEGIRLIDWWDDNANPDLFTHSGIRNTNIRNNEIHDLGFRSDNDTGEGLSFTFADHLLFENNHLFNIAHNGIHFSESVIQSPKEYGFDPSEIKTGDILVKDNLFEEACQLTTDCGALKIWGSTPNNHVFRNFLVTGNVFRDTFGWSYVAEKRHWWTGGESSEVRGMGGFGLYVDNASGVHAYRNIAYNNAYASYMFSGNWRDGDIIFINNLAANSLYGMSLGAEQYDTHGSVNTQVINNILINNEGFGMNLSYAISHTANITVDNNLYFNNGWRLFDNGGFWHAGAMVVTEGDSWNPYQTLAEVQANTPWEQHGVEGNPVLWSYDPNDHDLHDGSWPDFHLTEASVNAIDKGTNTLPDSLTALLNEFEVKDFQTGAAYDIGCYEAGFLLVGSPTSNSMEPGGTVSYTLSLLPVDILYTVTLSEDSPSPYLSLDLSPHIINGAQGAILTVTDFHAGYLIPGEWYVIPVSGTGSGFTNTANLGLLVGGSRIYLPVILDLR